jgi:hypothetical protein
LQKGIVVDIDEVSVAGRVTCSMGNHRRRERDKEGFVDENGDERDLEIEDDRTEDGDEREV